MPLCSLPLPACCFAVCYLLLVALTIAARLLAASALMLSALPLSAYCLQLANCSTFNLAPGCLAISRYLSFTACSLFSPSHLAACHLAAICETAIGNRQGWQQATQGKLQMERLQAVRCQGQDGPQASSGKWQTARRHQQESSGQMTNG